MAIRVSSDYSVQRYQKDLNELEYNKAKLMEQGDGSKLHRPGDWIRLPQRPLSWLVRTHPWR